MSQTWTVTCTACGELRWPYLPAKPAAYVCARCSAGTSEAKRAAGRKGAAAKARRSQPGLATEGQAP